LSCRVVPLHYITLHYITLHYITLHYITLHYITCITPRSLGRGWHLPGVLGRHLRLVFTSTVAAGPVPCGYQGGLNGLGGWGGWLSGLMAPKQAGGGLGGLGGRE
jgi:hypothetical protein